MSKSSIKYIRERRKVPAYIGRTVHYDGRRYRIAWTTSTGGLVLRDEIIVHPTDPLLNYSGDPNKALIEDEDCPYMCEYTLNTLRDGYFIPFDELNFPIDDYDSDIEYFENEDRFQNTD